MKTLIICVMTLAAATAQAVRLDRGTDAQVLIYPLFSAEGQNQTELVVRNLGDRGKALRLLLRDPVDGRPTLAINLYLADGDVWTGSLVADGDLQAALVSKDESCTFPALNQPLPLTDLALRVPADTERVPLSRVNFGYAEVYEMGELDPALASDCEAIDARWSSGAWSGSGMDQNADVDRPGGQLTGSAVIKNAQTGNSFVLDPVALGDFRDAPIHTHPELSTRPVLSDVSPAIADVRQVIQLASRRLEVINSSEFSGDPVAAVEAALATPELSVELHSSSASGANATASLLLPTAPYRLDGEYYGAGSSRGLFASAPAVAGSVLETDGDQRSLNPPASALDCESLTGVVNSVALPNFFNFDHVCRLGEAELFVPNNSARSYLKLNFEGQILADDGTVFEGLPVLGYLLQTTRGADPAGNAGNFARPMQRPGE